MPDKIVEPADLLQLRDMFDSWVAGLRDAPPPVEPPVDPPVDPPEPPEPSRQPMRITGYEVVGTDQLLVTFVVDGPVESIGYGRDGTDSFGTGPWVGALPDPAQRFVTLNHLRPGDTYEVTVSAYYEDTALDVDSITITMPPAPPPVPGPDPADDRRVPLVEADSSAVIGSGLGYNSIAFPGGALTLQKLADFGKQRGRKLDGGLTFTGRDSWDALRGADHMAGAKQILDQGGIVVLSVCHAPESEGDAMNQRGAAGAYAAQQRALGGYWAANGMNTNRFVLRIDWEFNGYWFKWAANKPGGPSALREAIRNAIDNYRAGGLTQARFDLCCNKGPSQAGADWEQVSPGPEWIDVIGVDQYDMWQPSYTPAGWLIESQHRNPSVGAAEAFAARQGVQWALDEGGNANPKGPNYGGDNPVYWREMMQFVRDRADTIAWHTTYLHPGAPATLHHDFASNPVSFEEYKRQVQVNA